MAFSAPDDEVITKEKLTQAIFGQESRSGTMDTSKPNYAGAVGPMQVTPGTFNGLKNLKLIPPDYDIKNPEHTTEAGQVLVGHLYNKFDGDPYKVAAAYYAGEKVVAPTGEIKPYRDLKNPKAPTAPQYAEQVVNRVAASAPTGGFSAPTEDVERMAPAQGVAQPAPPVAPMVPPGPAMPAPPLTPQAPELVASPVPPKTRRMASGTGEMFDIPFENVKEAVTKHGLEFTAPMLDQSNQIIEVPKSRVKEAMTLGMRPSDIPLGTDALSPYEKQTEETDRKIRRKLGDTTGDWVKRNLTSGGGSDIRNIGNMLAATTGGIGSAGAGAGTALARGLYKAEPQIALYAMDTAKDAAGVVGTGIKLARAVITSNAAKWVGGAGGLGGSIAAGQMLFDWASRKISKKLSSSVDEFGEEITSE